MANWNTLKTAVADIINANGNQAITGQLLQNVLNNIITNVGENATFAGIATPTTNPGAPDGPVFYLATKAGTYSNFNGIVISSGEAVILEWNAGAWSKKTSGFAVQSQLNQTVVQENAPIYTQFTLPFPLLKGTTIINRGVNLIVANNSSLEGRIDIVTGESVMLDSDKNYIQTWNTAGKVDFDIKHYAGYREWTDKNKELDDRITKMDKSIDERVTGIEARTNFHFVKQVDGAYSSFSIPFFFQKGAYVKNNGVTIILGTDSSLSERQDIQPNQCVAIKFDATYIKTGADAGLVDFEILNALPYGEWKERELYLPKRYIIENCTSYSTLNLFTTFPKGSTIVNRGVNIIVADNSSLEGRTDVVTGESVILDSDKRHIRVGSTSGNVDFEIVYFSENSIAGGSIIDGSISEEKAAFINPINLTGELHIGKYYNGDGGWWNDNPSYDATQRIPIVAGQSYCWNSKARFVHMLGPSAGIAKRTLEIQPAHGYVTAEEGEDFMVVTFYATDEKLYQVEKGFASTAYTLPNKKYLDRTLVPPSGSEKSPISFKRWNQTGVLATGETLTTPNINITKNIAMTTLIKGSIESVTIGVALNGYYGKNITLTPTELIVRGGTNNSVSATYQHGLNITDFAFIQISKENDSEMSVRLSNDKGEKYEALITWATSVGLPFVLNNSSESLDVVFNFMPRDITKDIWMFGDSYFGMYDASRWPYYILQWGYNQFLLDAKGGEAASEGLEDFKSLIALGARPKYVVWCHGMNGGRDGSTGPNATWLSKTQELISICLQNDIIPVLATIPSVPTEVHVKMNEWIKSSGHRYIDFASAVENETDYYWKGWGTSDALLSSDEVHPSVKGAIVLASQVMIDFPEISIS